MLRVETKYGVLQGREYKSVLSGKPYYAFQGIPYAKPPLGDLRFKPPQPNENWDGIYDATYERSSCIQDTFFMSGNYHGSEDCLHTNVYTPEIPSKIKTPKAVMVYFHGGAYRIGSSSKKLYSPDYLLEKDVIVVTFNYRLGIFGFLNLGLPECNGNAGLKDQLLMLKWIKENISNFGGDSKNITLFGLSTGAESVHYHAICHASKGLFEKIILQSGSCLQDRVKINPMDAAFAVGYKLGVKTNCSSELLQFLKQQSVNKLLHAVSEVELDINQGDQKLALMFTPTMEIIQDEASFLTDTPIKLSRCITPVPTIIGCTEKEALSLLEIKPLQQNIRDIYYDLSIILKRSFNINPLELPNVIEKVENFYFKDKNFGIFKIENVLNLIEDIFYFHPLYEFVEFSTKLNVPIYVYQFKYNGNLNDLYIKKTVASLDQVEEKGAIHNSELGYLFCRDDPHITIPTLTEDDITVMRNMTTLWTNFAKSTDPTNTGIHNVKWESCTMEKMCYLEIGKELKMKDGKFYEDRIEFWKNILKDQEEIYNIPYFRLSVGQKSKI